MLPLRRCTALFVVLGLALNVASALADAARCERQIMSGSAKLVQTAARVVQKCRDRVVTGSLPLGTDCRTEPVTAAKIVLAQTKLAGAISKFCGGGDHSCATPADDVPLASIGWNVAQCPDLEPGGCSNAIANCLDVATCVGCIDTAAVTAASDLAYGAFMTPVPTATVRCQRTIGKATVDVLIAKQKALRTCSLAVLSGDQAGPCPDAAAAAKIAAAEAKRDHAICSACGGADRACGGSPDLSAANIGFAPACPAVTVPGGAACSAVPATLPDVLQCLDCVSAFAGDCANAIATPGIAAYPTECRPPLSATITGPTSVDANATAVFDASGSSGSIDHYVWSFGHGTPPVTTTVPTVTHRFGVFGQFDVSVTVIHPGGVTASASLSVATTGFGPDNYMVRPVYFVPNNRTPQADWEAKFQTAMTLIEQFYAGNLEAQGFGRRRLNYEKDGGGAPVIHLITGQHDDQFYLPTGAYDTWNASAAIQAELTPQFDLEKDTLLIIADVQWYDPSQLADVGPWSGGRAFPGRGGMAFVGSPLPWLGTTVAEQITIFNDPTIDTAIGPRPHGDNASILIGGMAHELGHAFGAQHSRVPGDLMTGAAWGFRNYFTNEAYGGAPFLAPEIAQVFDNSAMFRSDHPFADNTDPSVRVYPALAAHGQPLVLTAKLADAETGPALFQVYFNGTVAASFDVRGMGAAFDFPFVLNDAADLPLGSYGLGYILYDGDSNRLEQNTSFLVVPSLPPIPPAIAVDPAEFVWAEDAEASDSYTVDYWVWQSTIKTSGDAAAYQTTTPDRQGFHSWFGADPNPMPLAPGDQVTAYVYISPGSTLTGIAVELGENIGGGIRLYWGDDVFDTNPWSTSSVRIGDLPPAGGWVRLAVPVETIGITEPRTYVNEAVRSAGTGTVFWDRLGKKAGP